MSNPTPNQKIIVRRSGPSIIIRGALVLFALVCLASIGMVERRVSAATTFNVPSGSYPTIQSAINAASPGDTILLAPGTYNENILIDKRLILKGTGSGTNPLVDSIIQSATVNTPVITITAGGDDAANRLVIQDVRVTGASGSSSHAGSGITLQPNVKGYLTLDDVAVVGNSGNGLDIDLFDLLNDIIIRNSKLSQNGGSGFRAPASSLGINGLEIADSHLDGNTAGGLTAFSFTLSNWNIHGSTFSDNAGPDLSYGMYLEGHVIQGLNIDCSEFSRNKDTNNFASSGLILSPAAAGDVFSNITIGHSKFDDNPNYGVLLQLADGSLIQNMAMSCDEFLRNGYGIVILSYGILSNGSVTGFSVHDSNFVGNTSAGIDNKNTTNVDAISNWWGAASGPRGTGPGTGDAIINESTGTVLFNPFRTAPSLCPSACTPAPAISIVKKTNGTDNDSAPGPYVAVGSTVMWTYIVTNTGNVTLTNVAVTDNRIGSISCPAATLVAGASMTCSATGTAMAGQYTNIGSVTGTPPSGSNVTASNPDNYFGVSPLMLTCPASAGTVNVPYSSAVVASGGVPPYTYTLASGSLPPGLTLNSSTGAITGTPTTAGSFIFKVKVTDSTGATAFSSCGSSCAGGVTTWNFNTPVGVLGTSQTYIVNGIPIKAYGFTNAGAATNLYGKNDGGVESGLGIAGTSADNEINTNTFVQLDLNNLITSGATNAQMVVNSVQTGEKYNLYGSNTLGNIGTLLGASNRTLGNTPFAIPNYPSYRYVSVRASYADVLITSVSFTVPAGCIITISPPPPTGCDVSGTLTFSGNSATSGTAGNIRTFSLNSLNVHASAFSRTRSGGTWNTAYLGAYSGGLGVTDGSEGDGSNDRHKIDNIGGRDNYVVLEFPQPVVVDRAFLDLVGADSDMTVWIGTRTNPYTSHLTLSDALLNTFYTEDNSTAEITPGSRWADLNANQISGNVIVIAALVTDQTPEDAFKLSKLDLGCPPPPTCSPSTFAFSGNTATSGTAGNIRMFSVNGVSVKVSALSRADSGGAWAPSYVGLYSGGLGVTDSSEGDGSNDRHKVDNIGGRNNYLLFEFSSPVIVDQAYLDIIGADSDLSAWIGMKTDPFNNHLTLSDALLTSLGAREDNTTSSNLPRWANINASNTAGNVLVISAMVGGNGTLNDAFKVSKVSTICH